MATLSRARYFVARSDGSLAPLIAVDELPPSVTIDGVPRTITYAGTVGMTSLGYATHPGSYLSVKYDSSGAVGSGGLGKSPEPSVPATAEDCIVPQLAAAHADPVPEENMVANMELDLSINKEHVVGVASEPSSAIIESTQSTVLPLENTKLGLKKAFLDPTARSWVPPQEQMHCRYWVTYGVCDYTHTQFGCRYKHEMPTDAETLGTLGLWEIPQWYQQTQAFELASSVTAEQAALPNDNPDTAHVDVTSVSGSEKSEQSADATPTTCSSPPLDESSPNTPPISPSTEMSEGEQESAFSGIKEDSMESTSSSIRNIEESPSKGELDRSAVANDHGRSLDKDYEESMGLTPDKTGPPVDLDDEDVVYHCQKCFDTLYSMRQVHQHVTVRGHYVRHSGQTYGEVPQYDSKGLDTYKPLEPIPVSRLNVSSASLQSEGANLDRLNCEKPSPAPVYRRLFETEDSISAVAVAESLRTISPKETVTVEAESPPKLPIQDARASSVAASTVEDMGFCPQCKKQGKTYHHRRWDCVAWMGTKDGQVYAADRRSTRASQSSSRVSRGRTASARPVPIPSPPNSQNSSETLVNASVWSDEWNGDQSTSGNHHTSTAVSEASQTRSWTTVAPKGQQGKRYNKPRCSICKKTDHLETQCWFRHPEKAPGSWTQSAAERNMVYTSSVQLNEPFANSKTVTMAEQKRRQRLKVCIKCMEPLHGGKGSCPNGWRFSTGRSSTAGIGPTEHAGKATEASKKPEENLISFADDW